MDAILDRWVAGDDAAAAEIYARYFGPLQDFLRQRGYRAADAEDVAQESLIAGLEGLRAGRRPDRATRWFRGIARHRASRQPKPAVDAAEPTDGMTPGARTAVIGRELREVFDRAVGRMPAGDREVVDLLRRGFSRKEIAERLGVALEAVHSRMDRAKERLRVSLANHYTTLVGAPAKAAPSWEAVRALKPLFRDAVIARHLDELPEAAAAARLGVPAATLRARLQSAYELLGFRERPDFAAARAERAASRPN